jgi:hypothetical protein
MGNAGYCGVKSNHIKFKQKTTTDEFSLTYTLIWLDDAPKKNSKLKYRLKQIDQQLIKFDNSNLCETYIKERSNDHFILSNDVYQSWLKQCQKVTHFLLTKVISPFFPISRS